MPYDKNQETKTANRQAQAMAEAHPGKRGDHPVGGAVGAAVGATAGLAAVVGAGATIGAATGTVAGPIGAAAGAVVGGVVGALAGKRVAEEINPTTEDLYWQDAYKTRDYVAANETYDHYGPAYRYGVDAYTRNEGRNFDEIESDLDSGWESARGTSTLPWERARPASQDAYERLSRRWQEEE